MSQEQVQNLKNIEDFLRAYTKIEKVQEYITQKKAEYRTQMKPIPDNKILIKEYVEQGRTMLLNAGYDIDSIEYVRKSLMPKEEEVKSKGISWKWFFIVMAVMIIIFLIALSIIIVMVK